MIDGDSVLSCSCETGFSGKFCDLTQAQAMELLKDVDKKLAELSSSEAISNDLINKLKNYQSIVKQQPGLATPELKKYQNLPKLR